MQVWIAIAVQILVIAGIWFQVIEIGSSLGNWVYPYAAQPTPWDVMGAVVLVVILAFGTRASTRWAAQKDSRSVSVDLTIAGGTFIVGILVEALIRSRYPFSLGEIVLSDRANGFYSAALQVDAGQLLGRFQETVAALPAHVRTNMPGKVILYRGLLLVTKDPIVLGWLIVLVSNLSAIAVFGIVRELFRDRAMAQTAMLLTILAPAKIEFQPILNTVSPVVILFALWCGIIAVTRGRPMLSVCTGILLYLQFLFEPISFALGIVFLALIIGAARYAGSTQRIGAHLGLMFTGFVSAAALMFVLTGFNIVQAFFYLLPMQPAFNAWAGRYYDVWVGQNLKEYFIGAGAAASAFVLLSLPELSTVIWKKRDEGLGGLLLAAFVATVLILDVLGVNRGEITRLWIFLTPAQALVTAYACTRWFSSASSMVAWGGALVQVAVCIGSVRYVGT